MRSVLFASLALVLCACSSEENNEKTAAPWDSQLELKNKAQQANDMLIEKANQQRKSIEEQTQ